MEAQRRPESGGGSGWRDIFKPNFSDRPRPHTIEAESPSEAGGEEEPQPAAESEVERLQVEHAYATFHPFTADPSAREGKARVRSPGLSGRCCSSRRAGYNTE